MKHLLPLLLLAIATAASAQTPDALLQQAQRLERVQGDFRGAIELYQQVAETGDRPDVARALLHMGKAYESLGRTEAFSVYERLVRDYSDQSDEVAEARERMAGLAEPETGPAQGGIITPPGARTTLGYMGEAEHSNYYGVDLSPTGREMALPTRGGGVEFVPNSDEERDLTLTPEDCTTSTFRYSPDGRHIAYGCFYGRGEVGVVDRESGKSRVLFDGRAHFGDSFSWIEAEVFDWTLEGDSIVVSSQAAMEGGGRGEDHILLVPLDGGEPRVIDPEYQQGAHFFWENNACLMVDDRYLFGDWVVNTPKGERYFYIQRLDVAGGTRENVLFDESVGYMIAGCDKSRSILYYYAGHETFQPQVYGARVQEDGSLGEPVEVATLAEDEWWFHPIAQDGKLYSSFGYADGGGTWLGTLDQLGMEFTQRGEDRYLDWSDDGTLVAASEDRRVRRLTITNLITGVERKANIRRRGSSFAWFPAGERFAVGARQPDMTWIFDAESFEVVDSIAGVRAVATSLDGEAVIQTEVDENGVCIVSISLRDRSRTPIRCLEDGVAVPETWTGLKVSRSRDLFWIAYRQRDQPDEGWTKRIVSRDGTVDWVIGHHDDPNNPVLFLPGDSVAVVAKRLGPTLLDLTTGEESEIDSGLTPGYSFQFDGLAIHPDGTRVAAKLNYSGAEDTVLNVRHDVHALFERGQKRSAASKPE